MHKEHNYNGEGVKSILHLLLDKTNDKLRPSGRGKGF